MLELLCIWVRLRKVDTGIWTLQIQKHLCCRVMLRIWKCGKRIIKSRRRFDEFCVDLILQNGKSAMYFKFALIASPEWYFRPEGGS